MRTRALATILAAPLLAVALAACGSAKADEPAAASADVPATTAAPTTVPAELPEPGSRLTKSQITRIEKLRHQYGDKYADVVDDLAAAGLSEPQSTDDVVTEACDAKTRDFKQSDETIGWMTILAGPTFTRHGHDLVEFLADTARFQREVTQIVDC